MTCPACSACWDPERCGGCDCADHWEEIVRDLRMRITELQQKLDRIEQIHSAELVQAYWERDEALDRVRRMANAWATLSREAADVQSEIRLNQNRELT